MLFPWDDDKVCARCFASTWQNGGLRYDMRDLQHWYCLLCIPYNGTTPRETYMYLKHHGYPINHPDFP